MIDKKQKEVAIIVAHPDDETLWAGGTVLDHPMWNCFVISVCRESDTNRAPRFYKALKEFNSGGIMSDLDDGPEQNPLEEENLEKTILYLLPDKNYDLIITHNPNGEYTRHLRHEEVSRAVINLWNNSKISTDELWTFAYEDGNKKYYPRAIKNASIYQKLSQKTWQKKQTVLSEIYGFGLDSWELLTTPGEEAFWQFTNSHIAKEWLNNGGVNK